MGATSLPRPGGDSIGIMQAPLETERLRLRPFEADDLDAWFAIWGDAEVIWWGPSPSLEATREPYRRLLAQEPAWPDGIGWLAVIERDTDAIVGDVMLQPAPFVDGIEVGWHFRPPVWNRGYATEAAGAMVDRAFREGVLEVVYAAVATTNAPSLRVAAKLGMNALKRFPLEGMEHCLFERHGR